MNLIKNNMDNKIISMIEELMINDIKQIEERKSDHNELLNKLDLLINELQK